MFRVYSIPTHLPRDLPGAVPLFSILLARPTQKPPPPPSRSYPLPIASLFSYEFNITYLSYTYWEKPLSPLSTIHIHCTFAPFLCVCILWTYSGCTLIFRCLFHRVLEIISKCGYVDYASIKCVALLASRSYTIFTLNLPKLYTMFSQILQKSQTSWGH